MQEGKPIFRQDNLLYQREEKQSYWTFIPKYYPETRELIINRTGKEILELCDGSRFIEDIEKEMESRYPRIAEDVIKLDVSKTIASFSRLGIIEWQGENPFLFKKEEHISDGYSMVISQEDDIVRIKEFIENSESVNTKEYFQYNSPLIIPGEYNEVALRQKLFSYTEEFFMLVKKQRIYGLLGVAMPAHPIETTAVIKLIISPISLLNNLIEYAFDNLPYLVVRPVTKIKLYELQRNNLRPELKEILFNCGFGVEAYFRNEIGIGKDIRVFSKFYTPDFLRWIDELREKMLNIS